MGTRLALLACLLWTVALCPVAGKRKHPPAPLVVVQALKPTGLRISVLDEEGMDLVIINANINVPLEPEKKGEKEQKIIRSVDGFWTLEDASQQLMHDDIVHYSVNSSSKYGQQSFVGHHNITDFVDASCKPSITTVNGQPACKGALIFEDNFDTLNRKNWKLYDKIWYTEFSVFVTDEEHSFAKEGVLHIKPTLENDESQLSELLKLERSLEDIHRCASSVDREVCEENLFNRKILPPVRSAWLTSTSSFKFVRVELRAKPAVGDWLFSGVYLFPHKSEYGGGIKDGEIMVMRARGNEDLRDSDGVSIGANQFETLAYGFTCRRHFYEYGKRNPSEGLYSDSFHTYAVTWTPSEIKFELDGDVFKNVAPPRPDGFLGRREYRNCNNSEWEKGSFMAPFDVECTLDIILNAGGVYMFPDGSKSGNHSKPWRNRTPPALFDFWRARDAWLPTWKKDLEVDYVKIWAI